MQYRYEQVAEIIAAKIRNGEWHIGQKIPGEIELAREYGVGRSTVRETLNILQQKGMIEKRHGSGTYVTENKKIMENPLLLLSSVGTMIKDAGYQAGSIFRSTTHELSTGHIQRKLNLSEDDKIVVVNRARTADGHPVAFSYNVFPQKLVGDIFDDGLSGSILKMLSDRCGVEITYADSSIKGLSHRNEWDMEQLHFDSQDRPVMYSFDYINTDLVKLHIRREIL